MIGRGRDGGDAIGRIGVDAFASPGSLDPGLYDERGS